MSKHAAGSRRRGSRKAAATQEAAASQQAAAEQQAAAQQWPAQPGHTSGPAVAVPPPPAPPAAPPALVPRPPAPIALAAAAPPEPAQGAVSTLTPLVPPPVVPRPEVSLLPTGRGSRKAAKRDERRKSLRRGSVVAAAVVGIGALIAGYVITSGGGKPTPTTAAGTGARTQHTLLLSIIDPSGSAYESALLAHDSASKQGVVVLVPANLQAEVAGRGSMALGDAAKVGPATLGDTLSDMINVSIDGQWNLSAPALAALVDHLGGITADVPTDITVNGAVVVAKGNDQLLNGNQAAAVATYAGADEPSAGRLARFQNVLTGLMAKLGTDPTAVATTIAALATGSTLAANTAVVGPVLAGLDSDFAAQDVAYQQLATTVLDTGDQTERLSVDATATASVVAQYFKQSVPPGRTEGHNRVIVFNGTGALGLGESARKRLTAHGLVFVRSANQPGFGYKTKASVVLVPDATPESIAAGKRVAAALGLPATDVETATVDTTTADVLVILGRDYKP